MVGKRTFLFLIAVFVLQISCSVPKDDKLTSVENENLENEQLVEKLKTDSFSALVVFSNGNVLIEDDGVSLQAVVGSELKSSSWISTGSDSECELSLGSHGSVILQSNTKIQISMLLSSSQRTASEISITTGTIIAKVQKLASGDQFRVRTPAMVAGVRGTVFSVTVQENKPVNLAVDEGLVAVYPLSLLPQGQEYPEGVAPADTESMELSEILQQSAATVAAGQELPISQESMKLQETVVLEALEVIRSQPPSSEKSTEARAARRKEVADISVRYQKTTIDVVDKTKPITSSSKSILQKAEKIELRSFDDKRQNESSSESSILEKQEKVIGTISSDENLAMLTQPAVTSTIQPPVAAQEVATIQTPIASQERPSDRLDKTAEQRDRLPRIIESSISGKKIVSISIDGGDRILVSDSAGKIYLVGPGKKVVWSREVQNGSNTASPAIVVGPLVVFSGDKNLFACNTITGELLWTLPLDATNTGLYGRHPSIFKNMVYVPGDNGILRYKGKTGVFDGSVSLGDGTDMSASIWQEALYVVSKSGVFYEIDPIAMAVIRSVSTNAFQPVASAPVFYDKNAFFADRRGTVTAIDLDSFSVIWQRKLVEGKNIEVFSDPVVSPSGLFIHARGTIYGLSLKNGSFLFDPKPGILTPPYAEGNFLWAGAAGNTLVEINVRNGSINRSLNLSAAVSGAPVRLGTSLVVPLQNGSIAFIEGYKP